MCSETEYCGRIEASPCSIMTSIMPNDIQRYDISQIILELHVMWKMCQFHLNINIEPKVDFVITLWHY